MKNQSVLLLSGIFLLIGLQPVVSTPPSTSPSSLGNHRDCKFSSGEEELCATNCYKSMKLVLTYILELEEKIRTLEENHSSRNNSQLMKRFEDLQSKIEQQNIDFITNIINWRNIKSKKLQKIDKKQVNDKSKSQTKSLERQIEQIKENVDNFQRKIEKQIEENIANQNNFKNKIEQILVDKNNERETEQSRNSQIDIETKIKSQKDNTKETLAKSDPELELEENNVEEEKNCIIGIRDLKLEVASLKQKLEESETQLTDLKHLVERFHEAKPKPDCKGLWSGIHRVEILGYDTISVVCNADIEGGGWIVIHKRFDGSVDFNKTWAEYQNGFGDLEGEFFIGLENLHRITSSKKFELYVHMGNFNGSFLFASYDNFRIGNENTKYKLESLGEFRGSAANTMDNYLNQSFSTFDQDNDQYKDYSCAKRYSAWWHKDCGAVMLNAKYIDDAVIYCSSMSWWWCYSLKSVQMLIRPK